MVINKLRQKTIKFSGAASIIFTIIGFVMYYGDDFANQYFGVRTMFMTIVYVFLALVSENVKGIDTLIKQVWEINCSDMDDDSKLSLIKVFLEKNVITWVKYWQLFQLIVNGKKEFGSSWSKTKRIFMRIPRGEMNFFQFCWVFVYVIYNVLLGGNFFQISEPIDFLINIGGLGFFLFSTGGIISIGTFMKNVFESIKPSSEKEVKYSLELLETNIIFAARHYGFLKNKIDIMKACYIKQIVSPKAEKTVA